MEVALRASMYILSVKVITANHMLILDPVRRRPDDVVLWLL